MGACGQSPGLQAGGPWPGLQAGGPWPGLQAGGPWPGLEAGGNSSHEIDQLRERATLQYSVIFITTHHLSQLSGCYFGAHL